MAREVVHVGAPDPDGTTRFSDISLCASNGQDEIEGLTTCKSSNPEKPPRRIRTILISGQHGNAYPWHRRQTVKKNPARGGMLPILIL